MFAHVCASAWVTPVVNLRNPSHAGKEACKKGIHRGFETIFTVCNSSCGKVMFSQTSVILSTGGGACVTGNVCGTRACVQWGMSGGGVNDRGHAWQGVCMAGVCLVGEGGSCVAGEMATAADGTHPTGTHSCLA